MCRLRLESSVEMEATTQGSVKKTTELYLVKAQSPTLKTVPLRYITMTLLPHSVEPNGYPGSPTFSLCL